MVRDSSVARSRFLSWSEVCLPDSHRSMDWEGEALASRVQNVAQPRNLARATEPLSLLDRGRG